MKYNVVNLDNKSVGDVVLKPDVFEQDINRLDVIHNVISWQLAKRRRGTHKAKEISEVSGSTRKIYRQKGTGNARHGSIRGAQFRGGGIIFGPRVRDYIGKINKKIRRMALKVAFSIKCSQKSIIILDKFETGQIKTAQMKKNLFNIGIKKSCLIIDEQVHESTKKSIANLYNIDAIPVVGLNVHDIYRHEQLIITSDALKQIEVRLK